MRVLALGAAATVALASIFLLFLTAAPLPADTMVAANDAVLVIGPLVAGVLCFLAAARLEGASRHAWRFMGAGAFAWAGGGVAWFWLEVVQRVEPFPSFADVGYLAAIPLSGVGLLLLARSHLRPSQHARAVLDGLIVASALLFTSWALVLGPVWRASSGTPLEVGLTVAYPLGDVLVGTLAVYAAARAPPGQRAPTYVVAGGVLLLAIADSGFAYLTAVGSYESGALTDAGWLAGYMLLGVAALGVRHEGRATEPREHEDSLTRVEAVLPYGPFVLAAMVAVHVHRTVGTLEPVLFWSAASLALLIAVRQVMTTIENLDLNARLLRANEDLRRAEAFRRQLLRNVSHDLGTALAPLEHHLDRAAGDAVARRHIEQLRRLTQDVRDVSELDQGGLSLQATRVDLVPLVSATVEAFHGMAQERGLIVETRLPQYLPVRADGQRLTQVLFHLLTLALRGTPPGGRVLVEVGMSRGHARVSVTHDGEGVQPALVFEPYAADGAGLGLYISRGIMEQHGGALECASENSMTTLALRLPLESFVLRA